MRKFFNKCFLSFFIAVLFFVLALLLVNYYNVESNFNQNAKQIQSDFQKNESKMQDNVKVLFDIVNDSYDANSLYDFLISSDKNFVFYVFHRDSLLFWSSNAIAINSYSQINSLKNNSVFEIANSIVFLSFLTNYDVAVYGFMPIYKNYPYQNKFLNNSFSSVFDYRDDLVASIETNTKSDIFNSAGDPLFSVSNVSVYEFSSYMVFIVVFFICLFWFFLIFGFFEFFKRFSLRWHFKVVIILFFIVLLRLIQIYFKFPLFLYDMSFFSPVYYAWNKYFSSIGDLFFNVYILFVFSFFLFDKFKRRAVLIVNSLKSKVLTTLSSLVVVFLFLSLNFILITLITHSILNLNFDDVFKIKSIDFVGFAVVVMMMIVFLNVSYVLLLFLRRNLNNIKRKSFNLVFFIVLCIIIALIDRMIVYQIVSLIVFYLIALNIKYKIFQKTKAYGFLVLLLFTVSFGFTIKNYNSENEYSLRKLFAFQQSNDQDPIMEFLFDEIKHSLKSDTAFFNIVNKNSFNEQVVSSYLSKNYFGGYFTNYHFQATICMPDEVLLIMPSNVKTECRAYFESLKNRFGNHTLVDGLWFLNDGTGRSSYLYEMFIPEMVFSDNNLNMGKLLYIELVRIPKVTGLGFPELLVDEKVIRKSSQYEYSYAKYYNSQLMQQYGNYSYPIKFTFSKDKEFFEQNNYSHLLYRINENQCVVVSLKLKSKFENLATFSYLFLILAISYYLIVFFSNLLSGASFLSVFSFKLKLQIATVSLVIVSFLVAGVITVNYFVRYNHNKNNEIIREKSFSVLIELEHKLSNYQSLTVDDKDYLSDLLAKFSNVFFTDLNLFSVDGELLATSRSQVFSMGLLSNRMNPQVLFEIKQEGTPFYLHKESIGNLNYTSAYLPFVNMNNELLAYLNLPYFARENELKNDISTFLVTFINFYVFLIVLAIILALFTATYITMPLKLISEKLRVLRPGQNNEKIKWKQNDEIGLLVREYNRMIDELETSTNQLMKNERETAWREMAKQIAHEIKNPLTPMKLSLQNLQRAWNDGAPDYEDRLKRTSQTLIEQIDTLAKIADEFSNFAKFQEIKLVETDLIPILNDIVHLYESDSINISIEIDENKEYKVLGNDKLLIQVFNNLVKNAVQSISPSIEGEIVIKLESDINNLIIRVIDNGVGISDENKKKIFSPNFTSKTGGTGLGLAISKKIIESMNAEISFKSTLNVGTEFVIVFSK